MAPPCAASQVVRNSTPGRSSIARGIRPGNRRLIVRGRFSGSLLILAAVAITALVVGAGRQVGVGDAMLAAFVVTDPHRLLVDLGARDHAHSLAGAELGADRRKLGGAVAVLGQLVGEAAHQTAACARNLA